jgi:hypothetical protein
MHCDFGFFPNIFFQVMISNFCPIEVKMKGGLTLWTITQSAVRESISAAASAAAGKGNTTAKCNYTAVYAPTTTTTQKLLSAAAAARKRTAKKKKNFSSCTSFFSHVFKPSILLSSIRLQPFSHSIIKS